MPGAAAHKPPQSFFRCRRPIPRPKRTGLVGKNDGNGPFPQKRRPHPTRLPTKHTSTGNSLFEIVAGIEWSASASLQRATQDTSKAPKILWYLGIRVSQTLAGTTGATPPPLSGSKSLDAITPWVPRVRGHVQDPPPPTVFVSWQGGGGACKTPSYHGRLNLDV